jgi:hypothetical protein
MKSNFAKSPDLHHCKSGLFHSNLQPRCYATKQTINHSLRGFYDKQSPEFTGFSGGIIVAAELKIYFENGD